MDSHTDRVDVIDTPAGRILCVADIRGSISSLNTLAAQHNASAIIHTGDFGFLEISSLPSIAERTLRHLVQYSPLLSNQFRSQLNSANVHQIRALLADSPRGAALDSNSTNSFFGLSEFPKLLSGELKLNVPVYAVWGACEDVAVLENIRLAAPSPISTVASPQNSNFNSIPSYSIPNLTVLDEATTRVIVVGGVRLRLFGLGGAVVSHKLFDNGSGKATIAGGGGTMWTTVLQIGELIDTAQKVYDVSETRLFISHASPGREGLLSQLALVLKADLTISAGLHFRYGTSYNEFSVQHDPEAFHRKLEFASKGFNEVWDTVKLQVEGAIDATQRTLLENALSVVNRVPTAASGAAAEEVAWKNTWNWNLPDASYGSLVLEIQEGRIGSEMKSQGFNFAYRQVPSAPAASIPISLPSNSTPTSNQQSNNFPSNSGTFSSENNHSGPSNNRSNLPFHPSNLNQPRSTTGGAELPIGPTNFQHTQGPVATSRFRDRANGGWGPKESTSPGDRTNYQNTNQQRRNISKSDSNATPISTETTENTTNATESTNSIPSDPTNPSSTTNSTNKPTRTPKPIREPRPTSASNDASTPTPTTEDGTVTEIGESNGNGFENFRGRSRGRGRGRGRGSQSGDYTPFVRGARGRGKNSEEKVNNGNTPPPAPVVVPVPVVPSA